MAASAAPPTNIVPVLANDSAVNQVSSGANATNLGALLAVVTNRSAGFPDRIVAADTLGRGRHPEAYAAFQSILSDKTEHAFLRLHAVMGLGALHDTNAAPLLANVLQTPGDDRNVRSAAALALGQLKGELAVAALAHSLNDGDSLIRFKAVQALERIADAEVVEPVTRALGDPDPYTRARAIHAMGRLRDRSSLPVIKAVLENNQSDDFTRIACLTSLGYLGGEEAAELLQRYQSSSNRLLRINAQSALRRLNDRMTP